MATPPSAETPDKADVVAAVRASLQAELDALDRVAAMSRDEVASDETRSEGKYDTRATEASYLALGQARRIEELRRLLAWFDRFDPAAPLDPLVVQNGALIVLDGARREIVLMAPAGGARVEVAGRSVSVVSPSSPLGRAMVDLGEGDAFEVDGPQGQVDWEIVSLR